MNAINPSRAAGAAAPVLSGRRGLRGRNWTKGSRPARASCG